MRTDIQNIGLRLRRVNQARFFISPFWGRTTDHFQDKLGSGKAVKQKLCDSSKSVRELGIQYHSFESTVLDMSSSLVQLSKKWQTNGEKVSTSHSSCWCGLSFSVNLKLTLRYVYPVSRYSVLGESRFLSMAKVCMGDTTSYHLRSNWPEEMLCCRVI